MLQTSQSIIENQQALGLFFIGLLITMGVFVVISFLFLFLSPLQDQDRSSHTIDIRPHEKDFSQTEAILDDRNKAA